MRDELSRERTPMRHRRRRSVATSGITWLPADQVPGGVLPASVEAELHRKLGAFTEHNARARVSGASYVICR